MDSIQNFLFIRKIAASFLAGALWALVVPLAAEPGTGQFNISDFGANGTDEEDDTQAIAAAIVAAQKNNGGEVFFPAGTYFVSPPGTAVLSLYLREDGTWKRRLMEVTGSRRTANWRVRPKPPVSSEGSIGEFWVDLLGGTVHKKTTAGWELDAYLVDKVGNGWTSGHGDPDPSAGVEGAVYLKFHVKMDHLNGAVFELAQEHNNITFRGEGPDASILSFRTWSGQDPMGYEVNPQQKAIVSSAIAQGASGRYQRGSLFVMNPWGTKDIENIHWEGLQMRGNTIANGKHNWYSAYDDLEEWDISNKCIVFTFGGTRPLNNITVRNCSINGWRGEVLYKGGDNLADIRIENCDIYDSNASAVSISGNVVMEDCRLWDVYNGVENYSLDGQFTEIRRCSISNNKGHWGIVYLGTDRAYLKVENCELSNAALGSIFLSDFASNVVISGNTITDTPWGVYFIYLNQYNLPGLYNNILIERNTFLARTMDMGNAVLSYLDGMEAKNWVIRDNIARGENGFQVKTFIGDKHTGPRMEKHNVLVSGNTIEDAELFSGHGLVPVFENNKLSGEYLYRPFDMVGSPDRVFRLQPVLPFYEIRFVQTNDYQVQVDAMWRYPEGHTFTIRRNDSTGQKGVAVLPGSWNSMERGYSLYDDASITLEMGADGLFHMVRFVPPTDSGEFIIEHGTEIAARGREQISLMPGAPTIYSSFSGLPVNVPIRVRVNENVRFANNNAILTPTGSIYDPDAEVVTILLSENGTLKFIEEVVVLPTDTSLSSRRSETVDLTIDVDGRGITGIEWFAGRRGDTRLLLQQSTIEDSGLSIDAPGTTGSYYYWARVRAGDLFFDSEEILLSVVPGINEWQALSDFQQESAAWEASGFPDQELAPDYSFMLFENRWTELGDFCLFSRNGRVEQLPFSLSWGPRTEGATFFFRFMIRERGATPFISFQLIDNEEAVADLPFTLSFEANGLGNFLYGPDEVLLSSALIRNIWYEAFLYLDFSMARYALRLNSPGTGILSGEKEPAWNKWNYLVDKAGISGVTLSSKGEGNQGDENHLLLDDFWVMRSRNNNEAPVQYSLWQNTEMDFLGYRETGFGLIHDAAYPWVLLAATGAWLGINTRISTLDSIYALYHNAHSQVRYIWTAELFGGWFYDFQKGDWNHF